MTIDRIYDYFERNPQLHVLFLFDKGFLEGELADVTWPEDFHYEVFDGCWFNAKYAIENTWADKKVVLLFRQPYAPQSEEEYLKFPLLDMLVANMEYKEDDYASFLQQYNLPLTLGSFVNRNLTELRSAKVMPLIEGSLTPELFKEDLAIRAFITSYLGDKKILEWKAIIAKLIILDLDSEEKKRRDCYYRLHKTPDAQKGLERKLTEIFGQSYSTNSVPVMKEIAEILKYNVITQLLAVEKSDPYKALRISSSVRIEQMQRIYEYGMTEIAGGKFDVAMKLLGASICEDEIIKAYGTDATYFILTEPLAWPIINSLCRENMVSEPLAVIDKARELRLKFIPEADIQNAISFMEQTATFYEELRNAGNTKLTSAEEYVARYASDWCRIDTCYRQSIRHYKGCFVAGIISDPISQAKVRLDTDYAKFVNIINMEWMERVNTTSGYLNALNIPHQFDFYKDQCDSKQKQVVIISDALRYEVGVQLFAELGKKKHVATLRPMIASLPTETKYCKPELFPHESLSLEWTATAVDGTVLSNKILRTAQLQKYCPDAECISYDELMEVNNKTSKRDFFKKSLIYILHDSIDRDGHDSDLPRACEAAVRELASLVNTLHASLNVTNVIITSDHGFLFNDINFEDKDKNPVTEETIEKKTRYYLTKSNAVIEGVSKFPIDAVSGISSSDTPIYVAVPNGTNRFAASGGYRFSHGGASLQEIVIPLIVSKIKKISNKQKVNVSLLSTNLNMVSSLLKFQLIQSEPVSMSTVERTVCCAVFNGDDIVTEVKTVILNSTDGVNLNNRVYDISLSLKKTVTGGLLQLRVWDESDDKNALIRETVKNNTFIEQDF